MIIRIDGDPAPKGSYTRLATGYVFNGRNKKATQKYDAWKQAVADAAQIAVAGNVNYPTCEACEVDVMFRLARGKTVKRIMHTVPPDVDKLARAMFDPLTGIVWADDSQVVSLHAAKRYARDDEEPGALVTIIQLGAEQPPTKQTGEPR